MTELDSLTSNLDATIIIKDPSRGLVLIPMVIKDITDNHCKTNIDRQYNKSEK